VLQVPVPHVSTVVVVLVIVTTCVRVRVEPLIIVARVELLFLEAPTRGPEMKEDSRARSVMEIMMDVPILLPN
jgi:hypothetical protein